MKVYTSPDLPMVAHLKNILESHGISCTIQQQFSSCAAGDIPVNECWPELWISDKMELNRAKAIVKESLSASEQKKDNWICPHCHEELEEQFTACWKCGREKNP